MDEKKVRYLHNEKNPVSEIDYFYAGLLHVIIEEKSEWRIKRHLDLIRYRMEAADDDLEVEISDELRGYASVFESSALELLDYCYRYF